MCVCTYKNKHTKHVLLYSVLQFSYIQFSSFIYYNNFLQEVDLTFPKGDQRPFWIWWKIKRNNCFGIMIQRRLIFTLSLSDPICVTHKNQNFLVNDDTCYLGRDDVEKCLRSQSTNPSLSYLSLQPTVFHFPIRNSAESEFPLTFFICFPLLCSILKGLRGQV